MNRPPNSKVNLDLIFSRSNVDIVETRRIVVRLFANRQRQTWPTMVAKGKAGTSSTLRQRASCLSASRLTRPLSG